LILVRKLRVTDDEGCSKTIRILSFVMGMIPVGARLVNLDLYQ
jgi:hypothetical protein